MTLRHRLAAGWPIRSLQNQYHYSLNCQCLESIEYILSRVFTKSQGWSLRSVLHRPDVLWDTESIPISREQITSTGRKRRSRIDKFILSGYFGKTLAACQTPCQTPCQTRTIEFNRRTCYNLQSGPHRISVWRQVVNMKSNRQLRKFLYRIVLTGILLSLGFGMGGSTTAQAQQAAVSPNPIYLPLVFRDFSSITKLTLMVYKSGDGSGTVTSSPGGINCGDACSYAFVYNTAVTLTASPTSPSTFGGWDGAGCSGTGTCTVTMSSTQSVTATFNPPGDQTLTVNKSGAGSGTVTSSPTGINCGTTCSYAFAYETAVILTASPTSPSTFSGWNGAGCSGTSTCTVSMSSAQSVTATFNLPGSQTLKIGRAHV